MADGAALGTRLDSLTADVEAQVIAWRRQIHAEPELANREVRTSALIAEHLRSLGLDEVRTGIAGHGVVGVLHGGRPGERVAALRADIDALRVRETSSVDFASTVVDTDYPGGPAPARGTASIRSCPQPTSSAPAASSTASSPPPNPSP